jgi:hypothetical protein
MNGDVGFEWRGRERLQFRNGKIREEGKSENGIRKVHESGLQSAIERKGSRRYISTPALDRLRVPISQRLFAAGFRVQRKDVSRINTNV